MSLQTITDEYVIQNRSLHEQEPDYGRGGWRHVEKVSELRDDYECVSVLDYGCGKGRLKTGLGVPDWVREYDPAIPGKDQPPESADLVVCTDVLEHIEPELLENVLRDLVRVTRKVALLVIATRESVRTMADGTSPHKIIENADWWREKLEDKFFILDFSTNMGSELTAVVSPIRIINEIKSKSAVSDSMRFENARHNCQTVKERLFSGELMPRHEGRVCIVGFGPSLQESWHYLLTERRAFGAKIVSVSGAHDFLIERGIVPDYHCEVDPREHKCFFTRNPHPDVNYWIASCCHPKLIDNLVANKSRLALWHLYNSDTDLKIIEKNGPDAGSLLICGGSGVGARAVHLMFGLGYRSFSLYGMDSSFAQDDGSQHAGEHSGKKKPEWAVSVGGRWFRSSAQMVYMARSIIDSFSMLQQIAIDQNEPCLEGRDERVEFFLHGDGLLQQMAMEANKNQAKAA